MELIDGDLCLLPRRRQDPMLLDWSGDPEAEKFGQVMSTSCWSELWDRRRRQAFWIMLGERAIGELEIYDIRRGEGTGEMRIGLAQGKDLGKGYGRRALRLALAYARDHLRLQESYVRVEEENRRAVACYRAVGFRAVGRLQGRRFPHPILLMTISLLDEEAPERSAGEA